MTTRSSVRDLWNFTTTNRKRELVLYKTNEDQQLQPVIPPSILIESYDRKYFLTVKRK